jgi:hypothetical protein
VTINTTENETQWGNRINDNTKWWLASWLNDITNKKEYVYLNKNSDF